MRRKLDEERSMVVLCFSTVYIMAFVTAMVRLEVTVQRFKGSLPTDPMRTD